MATGLRGGATPGDRGPSDASPGDTRPFSAFEWMISLRYLRARKEGFVSVIAGFSFLGIMLGVATLIIVMSVMNGFRKELFHRIMGLNGHVIVRPLGRPFDDYEATAARLLQVEGVRRAFAVVEGQALLSTAKRSSGGLARGMSEADLKGLEAVSSRVLQGTLDGFDQSGGVAIGTRLAEKLGVGLGDGLTLLASRGGGLSAGAAPKVRRYPVTAIFEIGMSEYDASVIFMPIAEAQNFFSSPGVVDVIELMTDDPEKVDALQPALREAAGEGMMLNDWRDRNATFYKTLEVQRSVMFIIISLIVLVAALNIVSGLIILVKDKGRDIAILRTMGATQGAVMRIFFITGSSIGIAGAVGGFLLGVAFCAWIEPIRRAVSWLTDTELFSPEVYFLKEMPAQVDPVDVAAVLIMALTFSVAATLYPSWRAARLDPVQALR